LSMLRYKFVNERSEFPESPRSREKMCFLRGKVIGDLLLEMLRDFRLPCFQFSRRRKACPIDSYAQCQGVLVLSRERDQIFVAKHLPYYPIPMRFAGNQLPLSSLY